MLRGVGSNRCLDVPSRATGQRTCLQIYELERRLMKQWTTCPTAKLQVYGAKCLTRQATPPAAGTRVRDLGLQRRANQQWTQRRQHVIGRESRLCPGRDWSGHRETPTGGVWTGHRRQQPAMEPQ